MDTTIVQMPYGRITLDLAVPTGNLLAIVRSSKPSLPSSDDSELERALREPIESPPLEQMVAPGMRIVIMASDITRPAPTSIMLPHLLARLRKAGIKDDDITVVFGMGIHRNHTVEEKRRLVGDAVYGAIRCLDSTEAGSFAYLGTTSRGTPVEVSSVVAEADFLIGTGNVEYHYFMGYSGGVKCVIPGACSHRTVQANHSMQLREGAESGSFDENPVRQDIEEAGRLIGLNFLLNVVLDDEKRIAGAFAGHPNASHALARRMVDEIYGVQIPGKADIVLASAGGFPKDVNFYQAQKGLDNASRAVRDGGTVILVAECPEGLGEDTFERYMTSMGLDEIIESITANFVLGGHKAAAIARVLKRADVMLVSSMPPELVRKCKMDPFDSLSMAWNEAWRRAVAKDGENRVTALVMPHSGSTVPR